MATDTSTIPVAKKGPALAEDVTEVVAMFPSDAALEDAISRLTLAGFDHADLSLPIAHPPPRQDTPEQGAEAVTTDTDRRQARTLATGTAASAAALAAAGVTVATGGTAGVAIAAAAIAGGAAAAVTNAIGQGSEGLTQADHELAAQAGELMLSVRVTSPARCAEAEAAMRRAGGSAIEVRNR